MAARERLTEAKVTAFELAGVQAQEFLWDIEAPGLGVRATAGSKSYVFQFKLNNKTTRVTIGSCAAWKLAPARMEARRLRVYLDKGIDPRHERAEQLERTLRLSRQKEMQSIRFSDAWREYIDVQSRGWGKYHHNDHIDLSKRPSELLKSGKRTVGGPISALLDLALNEISIELIEDWVRRETARRPRVAEKSFRLLRAFIGWCQYHKDYKGLVSKLDGLHRVRRLVVGMRAKTDTLQREMLPIFFRCVRGCANPLHGAYFQLMFFTGARPGELLFLKWTDVDLKWQLITLRDKAGSRAKSEETRDVPIGEYAVNLLRQMSRDAPRTPAGSLYSDYVFFGRSPRGDRPMAAPNASLTKLMISSGLPHLTPHGLRRSFSNACEWLDWPAGVKAQIMGHKPSATAERHYTRRPVDLLRKYQEKLEAWVISEANL